MATLTVANVSKHFGGVYALRDVSLTFETGQIVGLIGPNGAGKTTLINVMSSVYPLDAGEVRIEDQRIDSTTPRRCALKGIARTFQNIRLFDRLTVRQNVEVSHATSKRYRRQYLNGLTVEAILEELELSDVADRRAKELPYGQQRRLEIARARALVPEFLLLDEPAAGMNEAESEHLIASIRGIRDRAKCGIIVIDHDLRFIMNVCERIHVLHMGELIAEGPPAEVQKDPKVVEVYIGSRRSRRAAG